ncbi:hypothetical protein QCA50_010725 [Cerrena zonata]|uniref:Uncharacterized protein n=1 Tax=Cerrena zonata TaxID=2478898 RepID=A0AAW0G803_9APHY
MFPKRFDSGPDMIAFRPHAYLSGRLCMGWEIHLNQGSVRNGTFENRVDTGLMFLDHPSDKQ